jgi:hypothetical protein
MLLELNNVEIGEFRINAVVDVEIADQGIGGYEFWGMRGYNTRMGVDEYTVVKADYVPNQEDLPSISAKEFLYLDQNQDELMSKLNDIWADTAAYDDPDPDQGRDDPYEDR